MDTKLLPGVAPVALVAMGVAYNNRRLVYAGVGLYAGGLLLRYYFPILPPFLVTLG